MNAASLAARLEDAWRRFWFAEIPPHSYAVIRILIGMVGAATLIGAWNPAFWDVDGMMLDTGAWGLGPWLSSHGLGHVAGLLLRDVLLIAYTCLAVGIFTPVTVPLVFVGSAGMLSWNSLPYSGAQQLLHELPLCLIFVDSGAVWSVDAWRSNRKGPAGQPRLEPIWPLRLLQFQLALLYFSAGLWKMGNATWRSGLALHYVLNNHVYQRIPGDLPPVFFSAIVGLTYLTLVWELVFPLLVWFRATRPAMLVIGLLLHLGMWVTMEVGAFMPTILIAYVAFLDPELTERRVRALARLRST
jgi:hypothetical protein